MKISINIPSYRRPKVETLKYLPFASVWVAESEADSYREANIGADIVAVPDHIQGNVCRIRNYILDECFARGDDAVCILDDDFYGLYEWSDKSLTGRAIMRKLPADYIPFLLEKYTLICQEFGYKHWGVNPAFSQRLAQGTCPIGSLQYIGAPFSVHLNNPIRYDERLSLKEDFDMTLQHIQKYGGCLRINWLVYKNKMSVQIGGCATYRNLDREKQQFSLLQEKWGTKIIKKDKKSKKTFDYNPILKVPIKGV